MIWNFAGVLADIFKVMSIACEKWVEITWLLYTVKDKRAWGKKWVHIVGLFLSGERGRGRGVLWVSLLWRWEVAYSFTRANTNTMQPFQQGWWTASGERLTFHPLQLSYTFWDMNLLALYAQWNHESRHTNTRCAICAQQDPDPCTCLASFCEDIHNFLEQPMGTAMTASYFCS